MATDFAQERRWKVAAAKKVGMQLAGCQQIRRRERSVPGPAPQRPFADAALPRRVVVRSEDV